MAVSPPVQLDRQRIKELTEREERVLNEKTAGDLLKLKGRLINGTSRNLQNSQIFLSFEYFQSI